MILWLNLLWLPKNSAQWVIMSNWSFFCRSFTSQRSIRWRSATARKLRPSTKIGCIWRTIRPFSSDPSEEYTSAIVLYFSLCKIVNPRPELEHTQISGSSILAVAGITIPWLISKGPLLSMVCRGSSMHGVSIPAVPILLSKMKIPSCVRAKMEAVFLTCRKVKISKFDSLPHEATGLWVWIL